MSETPQATLARIGAAWNAGDATAYAAEFTPDATYVAFNGEVMRGRPAIEATHRWLFDGPLRESRMVAAEPEPAPDIRYVRPDVAVAVTGGAVQLAGAELTADRASVVSFVLVDDGGTWQVAAFQNTRRKGAKA